MQQGQQVIPEAEIGWEPGPHFEGASALGPMEAGAGSMWDLQAAMLRARVGVEKNSSKAYCLFVMEVGFLLVAAMV